MLARMGGAAAPCNGQTPSTTCAQQSICPYGRPPSTPTINGEAQSGHTPPSGTLLTAHYLPIIDALNVKLGVVPPSAHLSRMLLVGTSAVTQPGPMLVES